MSLNQTIEKDFIEAYKNKEGIRLSTARMLKTSILNKKIEKKMDKDAELSDDEIVAVIKSEIKKRKDSIEAYNQGGRMDLSEKEEQEIKVLEKYLPEQMSAQQLEQIVSQQATELGISTPAGFGKLMGAVMAKVGSKADGQTVSTLIKKYLDR